MRIRYQRVNENELPSKANHSSLLEHFLAGTTARAIAELVGVNRNKVNRLYFALRTSIVKEM